MLQNLISYYHEIIQQKVIHILMFLFCFLCCFYFFIFSWSDPKNAIPCLASLRYEGKHIFHPFRIFLSLVLLSFTCLRMAGKYLSKFLHWFTKSMTSPREVRKREISHGNKGPVHMFERSRDVWLALGKK